MVVTGGCGLLSLKTKFTCCPNTGNRKQERKQITSGSRILPGMGLKSSNIRLKGTHKCLAFKKGKPNRIKLIDCSETGMTRQVNVRLSSCASSYGRISCPCHGLSGKRLTFEQAKSKILGQVAMLGFGSTDEESGTPAWDRMRIGLATFKMLKCWQHKCAAAEFNAGSQVASNGKEQQRANATYALGRLAEGSAENTQAIQEAGGVQGPSELLDLESASAEAVGWDCG